MSKKSGAQSARGIQRNMEDFIAKARRLEIELGKDFDANIWTKETMARATASRQPSIHFVEHPPPGRKQSKVLLKPRFRSFMKAVIRYSEYAKPKGVINHQNFLRAGRYLHDQLQDRGFDPVHLSKADFDKAAQACKAREKISSAYKIGAMLASLARLLRANNLTLVAFDWFNPIPRPSIVGGSSHQGFDQKAMARKAEKMLQEHHIDAIGKVGRMELEPPDALCIRVVELLICTGFRINECLSVPADCLVLEEATDSTGAPLRDASGRVVVNLGVRYWPEKGGHTQTAVKWIPTSLKEVVQRAIEEIRALTHGAREDARYMLANPDEARLPASLQIISEEQEVSLVEVAQEFGVRIGSLRLRHLRTCASGVTTARFLKEWVRSKSKLSSMVKVPVQQSLDDSLFVVPANFFHRRWSPIAGTAVPVTDQNISNFISGKSGKSPVASIFERLDLRDSHGEIVRFTSHQPRHFLNTTLVEGGLPEHLIARHFGRTDISQNEVYDHTTPIQRAASLRKRIDGDNAEGPLARILRNMKAEDREVLRSAVVATAHVTDIGFCIHDWSSLPCLDHGRCAGCSSLVVEKGNVEHRERTEELVADNSWLLERTVDAQNDEILGANNHLRSVNRVLEFGRAMLEVHEDREIPDGTLIQISEVDGRPQRKTA